MVKRIVFCIVVVAAIIGISLFWVDQSRVHAQVANHHDVLPSWDKSSHDRGIVFSSSRDGSFGIYLREVKTGSEKLLMSSPDGYSFLSSTWSPDGMQIAYKQCNREKVCDLWVAGFDGRHQRQIGKGVTVSFTSKLAWTRHGEVAVGVKGPRGESILAIDVKSGNVREVRRDEDMDDEDPAYQPADDTLYFAGKRGEISWEIYKSDAKGKETLLFDPGSDAFDSLPTVARDGRVAFVRSTVQSESVFYQKTDGTLGQIPQDSLSTHHVDLWPDWSSDGKQLVYARAIESGESGVFRLFTFDVTTPDKPPVCLCTAEDLATPIPPTPKPTSTPTATLTPTVAATPAQ